MGRALQGLVMKCNDDYRHKITIERPAGTADAYGHLDLTSDANWTAVCQSYAMVTSKGGREFWKVQQVNADVTHVWKCPWTKTLNATTPDMRLKHEGLYYEILSVIDIDLAHEQIEIQTRRAVV